MQLRPNHFDLSKHYSVKDHCQSQRASTKVKSNASKNGKKWMMSTEGKIKLVWPDLAKFRRFATLAKFKIPLSSLKGYVYNLANLIYNCANLCCCMYLAKYWINNPVIWSHLTEYKLKFITFVEGERARDEKTFALFLSTNLEKLLQMIRTFSSALQR